VDSDQTPIQPADDKQYHRNDTKYLHFSSYFFNNQYYYTKLKKELQIKIAATFLPRLVEP
jgi:hypothetical protein